MKAQKRFVLFCWFAFLLILLIMTTAPLVSCGSKKSITSTETVKDSTWVKKTITPKDTAIVVPANHARVAIDWAAFTDGKSVKTQSGNLTATLSRKGDTIIADCNQAELQMIIQLQNELLEVYRLRETEKKTAEVTTKNGTPWYMALLYWAGFVFIVYLIAKKIK